jgi:hypothetical protein
VSVTTNTFNDFATNETLLSNASLNRGISIIGSALDSTPSQAGLRKTLERQPLIPPNREERLWKDDSAKGHMTHKNFNKTAF